MRAPSILIMFRLLTSVLASPADGANAIVTPAPELVRRQGASTICGYYSSAGEGETLYVFLGS